MNKAHTILGAVAAASLAGAASADINLTFENFIAAGTQFSPASMDTLSGSIDSALGAFTLNSGENFTWADDLTVMIANDDLSELHMQIGGYSDFGATHRFTWPTGASGDPGTAAGGTVDIGGIDVTGYKLWLGNGYASGGPGDWTGAIDLVGSVSYVPAPGALALLGLAGVSARRRRN
jgi:MYXO-CTERM domain-containing protein